MNAASSLSSSASSSSHLVCSRGLRRSSSRSPVTTFRSAPSITVSSSSASTTEKEHTRFRSSHSGGFSAAAAVAAPGSLYELLGLTAGATAQEIKTAYRNLARACHPDAVAADRKGASAEEFIRVHAAYATLSDPEKRAEYDQRMIASAPRWRSPSSSPHYSYPPPPASSRSSSFQSTRRTWETDQCW